MINLMGQIVTTQKELQRRYKKYYVTDVTPRAGWVVGKRTIYSGYNEYNDDEIVFHRTGTHECVLVAYWPTMNPIKVPLDGFTIGGKPRAPMSGIWEEKHKEAQRQAMKTWPRRANGQWKAYTELTPEERRNL